MKHESKTLLRDVSPDQAFWVSNGPVLKNLEELSNALPAMSGDTFSHHVNKEKNDFSNWVREAIGDKKLANEFLLGWRGLRFPLLGFHRFFSDVPQDLAFQEYSEHH